MKPNLKAGNISVFVTTDIKQAKQKLGINWRGLIIRGINSLTNNNKQQEEETNTKITRMAEKLNQQAMKIYELEKKMGLKNDYFKK